MLVFPSFILTLSLMSFTFVAGAGKSVLWYVYLPKFLML